MRTVWLLLRKDLLRRLRSPLGVLAMLAFPLAFSAMLAVAFGGGSDSGGLPAAKLLLHDEDAGLVGGFLKSFLQAEQLSEYIELVEVGEEGVQMMEDGEASALLTIPEGTTEALFDGDAVTFQLVRNPTQFILPEITEQILATLTDVASVVTRILHREADALQVDLGEDFDAIDDADFAVLALRARKLLSATGDFIDSPPLDLEVVDLGAEEDAESDEKEDEEDDDENNAQVAIFLFVLPGIAVYSLFVIGDQMMRDVVREGQLGTLRRQLTAPIRISQVILGKVLLSAVVAGLALFILATVMLFLVDVEVHFLAFIALSLALLLAISGFAAAIYGLVPNETRGSTFSSLLYLIMAFSGGSFVPLDSMPTAVQSVAHISPFYWGTQGFQKLLSGGGLADVAPAIGVLGGLGFVLLLVGMRLLHRHALKGNL